MQKRLFGVLASAAIAFAACGGNATPAPTVAPSAPASNPPSASAAPTPSPTAALDLGNTTYFSKMTPAAHTGGTAVMAEWQSVASFNPYYSSAATDFEVISASFDGFLTIAQDLKYVPDLVTEIPTVANGGVVVNGNAMDVTWHLKKGMLWSDNMPITCDDVIATWKWIMDPAQVGLAAGTAGWEDITSIDGAGGTDCVFHFKKLYEQYLLLVTALLPKQYISTVKVVDAPKQLYGLAQAPSAPYSGPFIPTEIKVDAQVTFKANPNWKTIGYGADTSKNHAPYLDKLIMKYYGSSEGMIAGFRSGEIDMAQNLSESDIPAVTDLPDAQKLIQNQLFNESNYYQTANFKKKFGADGNAIIRAIMMATNVDAVIAGPMGGTVKRACSFVDPSQWFYKNEACIKYDPAAAEASLDALGWTKGPDGVRAKGGVKIAIDYCTNKSRPYRVDTITLISAQLKQIGITAKVNAVPTNPDFFGPYNQTPADLKCNVNHGNFDVAMHGFIGNPDPAAAVFNYSSKYIPDNPPHDGANETRVAIPAMDAAWDIVTGNVDPVKIKDAMATIQDIYGSDQNNFELPFFNHQSLWLVSPKLHNFVGNPSTATSQWNVGDWWIDQ